MSVEIWLNGIEGFVADKAGEYTGERYLRDGDVEICRHGAEIFSVEEQVEEKGVKDAGNGVSADQSVETVERGKFYGENDIDDGAEKGCPERGLGIACGPESAGEKRDERLAEKTDAENQKGAHGRDGLFPAEIAVTVDDTDDLCAEDDQEYA